MAQLCANAHGEILEPGRVPDCYLGLLLDPTDHDTQAAGVLVVAPAALLHPQVPQPDGTVLYELVTGHPDRTPHELLFLTDLAVELLAWPYGNWATLGLDPHAAAGAIIAAWQGGHVKALRLGGLTAEEALALERPAMTYVREQLRERLARQLRRAWRRWLHPTSGRHQGDASCSGGHHRLRQDPLADTAGPRDRNVGRTLDTGHRRSCPVGHPDTVAGCGGHHGVQPATALRTTAAVRAPACDRARPPGRN